MQNFKPLAIFCGCTARLVLVLVRNPEDRFSHNEAQIAQPYQSTKRKTRKCKFNIAKNKVFECLTLLKNEVIECMEKWARKFFLRYIDFRPPPQLRGGFNPFSYSPHSPSVQALAFSAHSPLRGRFLTPSYTLPIPPSVQAFGFQCPPPRLRGRFHPFAYSPHPPPPQFKPLAFSCLPPPWQQHLWVPP